MFVKNSILAQEKEHFYKELMNNRIQPGEPLSKEKILSLFFKLEFMSSCNKMALYLFDVYHLNIPTLEIPWCHSIICKINRIAPLFSFH